jgi:hypothetical protein
MIFTEKVGILKRANGKMRIANPDGWVASVPPQIRSQPRWTSVDVIKNHAQDMQYGAASNVSNVQWYQRRIPRRRTRDIGRHGATSLAKGR